MAHRAASFTTNGTPTPFRKGSCDTDVADGISEAPGRVERWTAWAPGYPSRYPGGHAVRMGAAPEVEAGVAADA